MRNAKGTTPTTKRRGKEDAGSADKSGKKLKQARLPFKIIAPGVGAPSGTTAAAGEEEVSTAPLPAAVEGVKERESAPRKRKLSYDGEEVEADSTGTDDQSSQRRSRSEFKATAVVSAAATKKKKVLSEGDAADVVDDDIVLLDDEDDEEELRKEEEKKLASNTKKPKTLAAPSPKTPKPSKESSKNKTKGAGTPQNPKSSSKAKPSSGGDSASKLQIKLPFGGSKNKRRKSMHKATATNSDQNRTATEAADEPEELSADDLESLAGVLNPQKRAKVEEKITEKVEENKEKKKSKEESSGKVIETINLESEDDLNISPAEKSEQQISADKLNETASLNESKSSQQNTVSLAKAQTDAKSAPKPSNTKVLKDIDVKSINQSVADSAAPLTDNEADDEAEDNAALDDDNVSNPSSASSNDSVELVQDTSDNEILTSSNAKDNEGVEALKPEQTPSSKSGSVLAVTGEKKPLTPKQVKLLEQRRKARDDKERKLQEERVQKQREKEDREVARKRERDEKEELRRKEREERDEQKRKEREEKERQRLAESEAKNEEKRKRNEAKEEELRKKEDDRKRKEQEKEQAEAKKKKAAAAFTKFFVPKKSNGAEGNGSGAVAGGEQDATTTSLEQESGSAENTADAVATLAFRPFQVKGDMQMAPICRKLFSSGARSKLDAFLPTFRESGDEDENEQVLRTKPLRKPHLYLGELRSGTAAPVKWRRPSSDVKQNADDDDVLIIEDELERAGQAIVEETHRPVERLRGKYYKFHENRRPPFFGTWRKKTSLITARRPLGQDKKYFDYEIDSDLEWEEEEPGESLDGGSDDDKEKESGDDDDYEVDNEWFVPHGHLSDEELEQQNEEEGGCVGGGGEGGGSGEMGDSNTREAQKAKLKLLQQEFAQEMKKKTEKIKPRLVGCIWADARGQQPELCPNIIWETLQLRAMLPLEAPPIVEEPTLLEGEKIESESPCGANERTAEKVKPIVLSESMLQHLIRLVHGNRHSKVFLIKEFIAFVEANEAAVRDGIARGPLKSTVREKIDEYAAWGVTEAASAADSVCTNSDAISSGKKKNKQKKRLCWIVSTETLQRMDLGALDLHNNNWQYTLQPKFSTLSASANATTEKECIVADVEAENANERVKDVSTLPPPQPPADAESKGKRNLEITKFTKVLTAADRAAQLKVTASTGKTKTSPATADVKVADLPAAGKKRVPLLMSVARGAHISTSAKNALISQFLKKSTPATADGSENDKNAAPPPSATLMETEVVVLD